MSGCSLQGSTSFCGMEYTMPKQGPGFLPRIYWFSLCVSYHRVSFLPRPLHLFRAPACSCLAEPVFTTKQPRPRASLASFLLPFSCTSPALGVLGLFSLAVELHSSAVHFHRPSCSTRLS